MLTDHRRAFRFTLGLLVCLVFMLVAVGRHPEELAPLTTLPFIGEFMRRASLDELPQLINVLHGDMSLVGPRPERPYFINSFRKSIPKYMLRHAVKAGITGWAQVNGWRGNTSLRKRVQYDLYYIANWANLIMGLLAAGAVIMQMRQHPTS